MKEVLITIIVLVFFNSCKESNEELIDRAISYKMQGKFAEAISIYTDIINKNSKLQVPYYNRGLCYVEVNDFSKALADFNKVMSLQEIGSFRFTYNEESPLASEVARAQVPYNDALYQRAQVLCNMDSIKSSYRDFRVLVDENYEKSNCLLWQGILWIKGGDKKKACNLFNQAKKFALNEQDLEEANKFITEYCK